VRHPSIEHSAGCRRKQLIDGRKSTPPSQETGGCGFCCAQPGQVHLPERPASLHALCSCVVFVYVLVKLSNNPYVCLPQLVKVLNLKAWLTKVDNSINLLKDAAKTS
jgi:hypothetical protein